MKFSKLIFTISIIILIAAVSTAQSQCPPVHIFTAEIAWDGFGYSLASAGDVNNDGFADLIVGAPFNNAGGSDAGRAYVFSGQTGDTLYVFTGKAAGELLGWSVASAGDVNNDGFADLIVGAPFNDARGPDSGRAYVFSGQTGDSLYVFNGEAAGDQFGISVASAGDVDNDGFDDLIVGASLNDAGGLTVGRAYVFSGQTGDTLYVFTGEAEGRLFGVSVASAGDVNNDGFYDLIVGAPFRFAGGGIHPGRAYVFSGQTGDTLYVFAGEAASDEFGRTVASAGDVNNDGFDDLIVGAIYNSGGGSNAGRTYVFSGQTGDTIHVFTGEAAGDGLGVSVASAGDVNNDGFDDIIVGALHNDAGGNLAGRAYVFSGQSGNTLYIFTGEAAFSLLGFSVASAGDVNNDGYYDLIVRSNSRDLEEETSVGRAYVYLACGIRGDFNGNGTDADFLDLTYLIDDMFRGGLDSPCSLEADINSDGTPSDILDLTFLIDSIYRGGPAPAPCF